MILWQEKMRSTQTATCAMAWPHLQRHERIIYSLVKWSDRSNLYTVYFRIHMICRSRQEITSWSSRWICHTHWSLTTTTINSGILCSELVNLKAFGWWVGGSFFFWSFWIQPLQAFNFCFHQFYHFHVRELLQTNLIVLPIAYRFCTDCLTGCLTDFLWSLNMVLDMILVECGFHRPKVSGIAQIYGNEIPFVLGKQRYGLLEASSCTCDIWNGIMPCIDEPLFINFFDQVLCIDPHQRI